MSDKIRVRIWDLPVRAFHWLVVILIGGLWYSARIENFQLHKLMGYAMLTLLLFRLAWGVAGSDTARFAAFVKGPAAVWRYARQVLSVDAGHAIGHNPLGALSVMALLLALFTQTLTGLFLADLGALNAGPLVGLASYDFSLWCDRIHRINFTIIKGLIVLHVAAIAWYLLRKQENLVTPMVTGWKQVPSVEAVSAPRLAPLGRALVFLLISAAIVSGIVIYGQKASG